MSESRCQRLLLLRAPGAIPNLRLFRRNVGMAIHSGRHVHYGIKGQCDLEGIIDGGRHIELECKARNGRLNGEQAAWRDWCRTHKVPWLCLTEGKSETEEETIDRWVSEIRALLHTLRPPSSW
jgi:hypothetical protein